MREKIEKRIYEKECGKNIKKEKKIVSVQTKMKKAKIKRLTEKRNF